MKVRLLALIAALVAVFGLVQTTSADAHAREGSVTSLQDVYVVADQTVDGDVNVLFGDATIAGIVRGDCNAPFGRCLTVGNGQILGQQYSGGNEGVRAFVPWAFGGREHGMGALAEQDHRLLAKLASSAVVVLIFLLFPLRMRVALDRIEKHPALSALTGAVAAVAMVPIAIVLLVSIIGIPLVVLEIAALFAAFWIGTGAIALLVGRRLCELVMPAATPSPLVALILGLVVVSAAEIVPIIGWAVTALVWLAAVGATILSFIRSVQLDAAVPHVPISGARF